MGFVTRREACNGDEPVCQKNPPIDRTEKSIVLNFTSLGGIHAHAEEENKWHLA